MRRQRVRRAAATIAVATAMFTTVAAVPTAWAATVDSVRSWSAGTITAGQSKSYIWNNANSDIYQVNTGAVRSADAAVSCAMEVTSQRYRAAAGSQTFRLTVKNIDSVSCDVTIYLAIITADRSGSTGTIDPGQSKSWKWNNANVNSYVYFAGVTPSEPASGTCQLEVSWKNRAVPDGEQEYVWIVRNTGSVACAGQWRLGWLPVDDRTTFPSDDPPSQPGTMRSLSGPVQEPFRVYFFGILAEATSAGNCEWGPDWHRMLGDPAVPTAGARWDVGYRHIGPVPCVLHGITRALIS